MRHAIYLLLSAILLIGCNQSEKSDVQDSKNISKPGESKYTFTSSNFSNIEINVDSTHFRGLTIKNDIAFIAGTKGSYLQYDFGSESIQIQTFLTDTTLHFRDVEPFNEYSILMGITEPAGIFKYDGITTDTIYINDEAFIDGMAFWSNGEGVLFGDPMDNQHFIMKSNDNGNSWSRIFNNIPAPIENEAGFAASGTSIVCIGDGIGYIGLGGEEVRVFKTMDYGKSWSAQTTPMPKNQKGTGIYSMAFKDEKNGVAVGGNWEFSDCDSSKLYTQDGGGIWQLSKGDQNYRSCVTYVKDDIYVATGTNGTDITYDGGKSWELLDSIGFNAIQFNTSSTDSIIKGIGVGNYGLIRAVQLKQSAK